jgi:hypothetical protein
MISFKRFLVAGFATLVVAGACTNVNIPTIPPINIPSIPPIHLPSIPPINIPGQSIPPINLPSIPPITLPSGIVIPPIDVPTGSVPCALISSAEVGQIWGSAATDTSDNATNCTFISTNFTSVSVQATTDTDLSGAGFLFGNTAQQITVGGFPAVSGVIFGQPAIYVQKPSGQLQVLGILTGTDAATVTKLQQIATVAVGRMP